MVTFVAAANNPEVEKNPDDVEVGKNPEDVAVEKNPEAVEVEKNQEPVEVENHPEDEEVENDSEHELVEDEPVAIVDWLRTRRRPEGRWHVYVQHGPYQYSHRRTSDSKKIMYFCCKGCKAIGK